MFMSDRLTNWLPVLTPVWLLQLHDSHPRQHKKRIHYWFYIMIALPRPQPTTSKHPNIEQLLYSLRPLRSQKNKKTSVHSCLLGSHKLNRCRNATHTPTYTNPWSNRRQTVTVATLQIHRWQSIGEWQQRLLKQLLQTFRHTRQPTERALVNHVQ